jgi:hypothetical protein
VGDQAEKLKKIDGVAFVASETIISPLGNEAARDKETLLEMTNGFECTP